MYKAQLRQTASLVAIAFGVGYFAQEIQPTLSALDPTIFDPRAVGWITSIFSLSQAVSLIIFGYLTDNPKTNARTPYRVAAGLFLSGALASLMTNIPALFVSRLFFGAGCGSLVAALRTGNKATVFLAMNLGLASGLFLPVLGRGLANTIIALTIGTVVLLMPRLGRTALREDAIIKDGFTTGAIIVGLLPFFSAGAYTIFQMIFANALVPSIGLALPSIWLGITIAAFVGVIIGTDFTRRKVVSTKSISIVLTLLAVVYVLPVSPINGVWLAALLVGASFFLNLLDGMFEVLFAGLVAANHPRGRAGQALGWAFMTATIGRAFWSALIGEWRERGATIFLVLLLAGALAIVAAVMAHMAGRKHT